MSIARQEIAAVFGEAGKASRRIRVEG